MKSIQIRIDRKTYRHGAQVVDPVIIRDLRISLSDGEFVCLVGPSGCGKTTLLNILAGLDPDFEGTIRSTPENHRPRMAYVFQNPRLLPWRTVRQNIELALSEPVDPDLIEHLLQAMDVAQVQHQYPQRLSVGMSRRVALVRAFATQPDLLLMDEPFVSLDAPTARRVRQLLVRVWRERPHTVLFVTHDLREAISLADRLIFLSSHPMMTAAEVEVTLEPEARQDLARIDGFHRELLAENPALAHLL